MRVDERSLTNFEMIHFSASVQIFDANLRYARDLHSMPITYIAC